MSGARVTVSGTGSGLRGLAFGSRAAGREIDMRQSLLVALVALAAAAPAHSALDGSQGARLVLEPGLAATSTQPAPAWFRSPRRVGVDCGMFDQPGSRLVRCQSKRASPWLGQTAKVSRSGKVRICRSRNPANNRCGLADPGEGPLPKTLRYGKQITVGRFRCRSLRSGIRCVLIESGKGFRINKNRVVRVGQ